MPGAQLLMFMCTISNVDGSGRGGRASRSSNHFPAGQLVPFTSLRTSSSNVDCVGVGVGSDNPGASTNRGRKQKDVDPSSGSRVED